MGTFSICFIEPASTPQELNIVSFVNLGTRLKSYRVSFNAHIKSRMSLALPGLRITSRYWSPSAFHTEKASVNASLSSDDSDTTDGESLTCWKNSLGPSNHFNEEEEEQEKIFIIVRFSHEKSLLTCQNGNEWPLFEACKLEDTISSNILCHLLRYLQVPKVHGRRQRQNIGWKQFIFTHVDWCVVGQAVPGISRSLWHVGSWRPY